MLEEHQRNLIHELAYLPEHVPDYVQAVSGAEPFLHESRVCFLRQEHLILVGYPLVQNHPIANRQAYLSACERFRPSTVAVIAPSLWSGDAPAVVGSRDDYYRLELPLLRPAAETAYMIRRARRELDVSIGHFGKEHLLVIENFLENRDLDPGHQEIFKKIPDYLAASDSARLIEARRGDELAAFSVVDIGSADYAFYLFSFRSRLNIPGASDLLFFEMAELAAAEGKKAINLGLGVSPGIRRFKEKWGGEAFLPYFSAVFRRKRSDNWEPIRRALMALQGRGYGHHPAS